MINPILLRLFARMDVAIASGKQAQAAAFLRMAQRWVNAWEIRL